MHTQTRIPAIRTELILKMRSKPAFGGRLPGLTNDGTGISLVTQM